MTSRPELPEGKSEESMSSDILETIERLTWAVTCVRDSAREPIEIMGETFVPIAYSAWKLAADAASDKR